MGTLKQDEGRARLTERENKHRQTRKKKKEKGGRKEWCECVSKTE